MRPPTKIWPSAGILLTGLPGSGKTTLSRALVRRLNEYGIRNVALFDAEEFPAGTKQPGGHGQQDVDTAWRELVEKALGEMESGKVVVIDATARLASMRALARKRLQPFFEVHLDGRAVDSIYERKDPVELRIDTAALSPADAEKLLAEQAIEFLGKPVVSEDPARWFRRRLQAMVVNGPTMNLPDVRRLLFQNAQASKPVVSMERPSCAQLMVIYGGIDAFLGTEGTINDMSPLEFLRVSGLFGRNLVWIRDPHGENFARGISDELPDVESLAEWTVLHAKSLPHVREVHAIGYSSGSYGALLFGHLCRMQSVWAFSPRAAPHDDAEEATARLVEMLSEHNGVTEYHVWYSALNKADEEFASRVAGRPGLTLHPYRESGDDHYLIRHLAENGILRTILPPFVPSAKMGT